MAVRASAIAILVGATAARADTVRLVLDQSQPSNILVDRELPAGKEFTAELQLDGLGAADQAVLEIWASTRPGDRCAAGEDAPQYARLAMAPTTSDGKVVFRATVPPRQLRERYCLRVELYKGMPRPAMERIVELALDRADRALGNPSLDVGALRAALEAELAAALAPELITLGLAADAPGVAGQLAARALDRLAATDELKELGKTLAVLARLTKDHDAADGPVAVREAALGKLRAALTTLPWPDRHYYFVQDGALVSADTAWLQLADPGLRKELAPILGPQLAERLRGNAPSTRELLQWRAELTRVAGPPPAQPPLAAPPAFDLWSGSRFVATTAGDVFAADPAFDAAAIAQLASLARELTRLEQRAQAELAGPPAPSPKRAAALGAAIAGYLDARDHADALRQALAAYVDADAAAVSSQARIDDLITKRVAQRAAVRGKLRELTLTAFADLKFRLSSGGPPRSGLGTTTSIDNWISLNVGAALAAPTIEVDGEHHTSAWFVPYFAVNVHAPVERSIPPGRLVDELWQRLSLTGGVALSTPDPLRGRTIRPILFDRPALLSVGVRVTPYSRVALGVMFYRIQANPLGGDPALGLAPFVGYSLDLDAVKLVKDGFANY